MRMCPHCGSEEVAEGSSIGKIFQYYCCEDCHRSYREYTSVEFDVSIARSKTPWYLGFAMLVLVSLLALARV